MTNMKKQTGKRLFHGALAALLAATVLTASLAGCSGGDKKQDETKTVTETQVETKVVNGVYVDENGNVVTDPNGSAVTAPSEAQSSKAGSDTKQSSKTASGSDSGSGSGNSGNGGNSGSSSGSSSSKSSGTGNQTSKASGGSSKTDNTNRKTTPKNAQKGNTEKKTETDTGAKNLKIGDMVYNTGDKIVCTYYLMVPESMVNFQGTVSYDSSLLKVTDAYLIAPASYGALVNSDLSGMVKFNGSMLNGYDFTDPGYDFLVVEYEVLKNGVTNPAINFEVITGLSDKTYAGSNGVLSNGAKVWTVYE